MCVAAALTEVIAAEESNSGAVRVDANVDNFPVRGTVEPWLLNRVLLEKLLAVRIGQPFLFHGTISKIYQPIVLYR